MTINELKQQIGAKNLRLEASVVSVYPAEQKDWNGKVFWSQGVVVKDSTGVTESMKLAMNTQQEALPPSAQGRQMAFQVSVKQGTNGTVYLNAHLYPDQQAADRQAPQSPQQANQPVSNGEEVRVRSMCLSYAKDLVAADRWPLDMIYTKADNFYSYITTGKKPNLTASEKAVYENGPEDPNGPDYPPEDIPY